MELKNFRESFIKSLSENNLALKLKEFNIDKFKQFDYTQLKSSILNIDIDKKLLVQVAFGSLVGLTIIYLGYFFCHALNRY